jgi:ribosomal RNA-processing protein 12
MRLRVLSLVVQSFEAANEEQMMKLAGLLGEVLLCLKDSNAKTREAAYQLLLLMARGKHRGGLEEFTQMVVAALAGDTPHMCSAAVSELFGRGRPSSWASSQRPPLHL